jgi:hypothetical protein
VLPNILHFIWTKRKYFVAGFLGRSGQNAWLELSSALPRKLLPEALGTHDTGMVVLGNACAVLTDAATACDIAHHRDRRLVDDSDGLTNCAKKYGSPNMASRYVPTHDS